MTGIIEKYHEHLPIPPKFIVSLEEGNTPLLSAERLAKKIGVSNLFLKLEGLNPTGSFKDRGMTYAVSKAFEAGSRAVICASTGNTAASAAAYAARAGLKCFILLPQGKVARGKLAQAMIHEARVVSLKGNFDEALEIVKQIAEEGRVTLVNSLNPHRLEGQKTAAFEVCEQLGGPPTHHALPVGNAGNITAYWRGYQEWLKIPPRPPLTKGGWGDLPKMLGFQAAGAAPIVLGKPVKNPKTFATAIRIGNPAAWKGALQARDESGGLIDKVTDQEIEFAYKLIAATEGYFCEPASAASVAGVWKLAKKGWFKTSDLIVCTLTGHGLKDPDAAVARMKTPVVVESKLKSVKRALGL